MQDESRLVPLGDRAGGCTEACSEMHTFTWPCEQAMISADLPKPERDIFDSPIVMGLIGLLVILMALCLLYGVAR